MLRIRLNEKKPSGNPVDLLQSDVRAAENEAASARGGRDAQFVSVKERTVKEKRVSFLVNVSHVLLALFTFAYIVANIFFGGFYAGEYHTAAMVSLISFLVLLILIPVLFVFVFRIHRYTAPHLLRWLLFLGTIAISVISFSILGAGGYILVAVTVGVGTLTFDIIHTVFFTASRGRLASRKQKAVALLVVTLIVVATATLSGIGVMPLDGDNAYVETSSIKRSVKYSMGENGEVMLEKVMLTAYDALGIKTDTAYRVLETVTIGKEEYKVTAIGKDAFVGVRSFDEVIVPDYMTVHSGAFEKSGIGQVTVEGHRFTAEDGFVGSEIERVVFENSEYPPKLILGDGATLKEGITVTVDREQVDDARRLCPDIAYAIAPAVSEGEAYVTYNVTVPEDTEDLLQGYIETGIYSVSDGSFSFELPYSGMLTENASLGTVWELREEGRTFRLKEFTVNGAPLEHNGGRVTASSSMNVTAVWEEIFTVSIDLTEWGGGVELLGELPKDSGYYALPDSFKSELHDGYTAKYWKILAGGEEGLTLSTLFKLDENYVISPVWTLDAPTATVEGIDSQTYDALEHTLSPRVAHPADGVTYSYSWLKDGAPLSETPAVTVKKVSDSGSYSLTVTVTDGDGMTASTTVPVTVNITAAPLTVTANAAGHIYGEQEQALTYSLEGLLGEDTVSGELTREQGDGAGEYAIGIGSVTAGENYLISFVGASYTVSKADYDMQGVSLSSGSFEYDGQTHSLAVEGELPTGLDGIRLTVSYEGARTDAGSSVFTAVFATESQNYNIPEPLTAEITVTKKPLTVTANAVTAVYGTTPELTYSEVGLVSGDSFSGALSAEAFTAGEHKITLGTLTAGDNYEISFTTATLTVTKADYQLNGVKFEDITVTYDGKPHHPVISAPLPEGADGIALTVRYEGSATHVSDGKVTVTAVFESESGNYNIPESLTATVTVTKRTLTVTANGVTITYGDEEVPLTYTAEGLVEGDSLSGSLNRENVNSASTYAISQGSLTAPDDYELKYIGADYVIKKKTYDMSGVSLKDLTVTYDGAEHHAKISGTLPTGIDGIQLTVTYEGAITDAGRVTTVAKFHTVSGNYEIPESLEAITEVTKRALTVTASSVTVVYGEEDYAIKPLTYTEAGLVEGDLITGELIREQGADVGVYAILRGTLTAGDNYEITFVGAEYAITKADYDMSDVKFEDITVVYDGEAHRPTVSGELPFGIDGIQVTVSYSGSATNVADGTVIVTATFATESNNYNAPEAMTATVTVTPMKIKVPAPEVTVLEHNGGEEVVFLEDDPDGLYTVEGGSHTDVGRHTATLTLKNENYAWEDPEFNGEIAWEITEGEENLSPDE